MAKAQKAETAAPKKQAASISQKLIEKALEHAEIAHPHAEFIYMNAKGEYHLHPRPGFVKVDKDGDVYGEIEAVAKPVKATKAAETTTDELPTTAPNDGREF
jgi:hypothetical protein